VALGTYSAIFFTDFDGDLDYDACVTGMDATGTITSTKYYYKNTGTQAAPNFTLQSSGDNIFDVTTVTALRLIPTCFGADNDGDIDCMFGTSTGTVEYTRNTGTNTAPAFTHATSTAPSSPWDAVEHPNPLGTIDVGAYAYSAPTCFNIDAEGTGLAHCSAHGLCKHPSQCGCFDGWGSASDLTAVGFGGSKGCSALCPHLSVRQRGESFLIKLTRFAC
jgi:hypothetical protein